MGIEEIATFGYHGKRAVPSADAGTFRQRVRNDTTRVVLLAVESDEGSADRWSALPRQRRSFLVRWAVARGRTPPDQGWDELSRLVGSPSSPVVSGGTLPECRGAGNRAPVLGDLAAEVSRSIITGHVSPDATAPEGRNHS